MDDFGWMVHDGTYRAVIWPFRTREEAIAWRGEFCLSSFVVEPLRKRADVRPDPPVRRLRRGPAGRTRRR